jgi:uncharacterized protein (DUF983 family)
MARERRSIITTLSRSARLACPACGESSIVQSPFQIKHHCPVCQALFKREDGFFVGAILANVVTTEIIIMVAYGICLLTIIERDELMLATLFGIGVTFPIAFYHHSWSFWLGFDYFIESLPKYVAGKQADPP